MTSAMPCVWKGGRVRSATAPRCVRRLRGARAFASRAVQNDPIVSARAFVLVTAVVFSDRSTSSGTI